MAYNSDAESSVFILALDKTEIVYCPATHSIVSVVKTAVVPNELHSTED